MNVLSLFDGISCGRLALERAGIKVDNYYSSEIDQHAIKISQKNWSDITQLGDVNNWREWDIDWNKLDLVIGGSPCQGFSFAGKQLNFSDPRSALFFEFNNVVKHAQEKNPAVKFLLENVKMKQEFQDVISGYLGTKPTLINSALVSAQNRNRLYWSNFPIAQPVDKNVYLKDIILEDGYPVVLHNLYGGFKEKSVRTFVDKSPTLRTAAGGGHIPSFVKRDWHLSEKAIKYMDRQVKGGRSHWDFKHHSDIRNPKSAAVVANFFKGVMYNVFKDWDCVRKFHPVECERLQTLPDGYTEGVSNTQRYKAVGNGWTVDVISHILSQLK